MKLTTKLLRKLIKEAMSETDWSPDYSFMPDGPEKKAAKDQHLLRKKKAAARDADPKKKAAWEKKKDDFFSLGKKEELDENDDDRDSYRRDVMDRQQARVARMAADEKEPYDDTPADKSRYTPREVEDFKASLSGVYSELRKFDPESYEWDWKQNTGINYNALSSPEVMNKHVNKILNSYGYKDTMSPEEAESIVRMWPEIEKFFRPVFDLANRTHPAAPNSDKNLEAIKSKNNDPAFWEKINNYRSLVGWGPSNGPVKFGNN